MSSGRALRVSRVLRLGLTVVILVMCYWSCVGARIGHVGGMGVTPSNYTNDGQGAAASGSGIELQVYEGGNWSSSPTTRRTTPSCSATW